jgi:centrosomal protein CEP104
VPETKITYSLRVPATTVQPVFNPIIRILIEKLADGNAKIRDGAYKGLECLAASGNIGPKAVGEAATKELPPKNQTAWRPILARLKLLTDLVNKYGISGSTGLSSEHLFSFAKSVQAFTHSNGEVRDAAKELTVAIQRIVGTPPIHETLKQLLRPKQLEEYMSAFEASGGGGGARGKPAPSNVAGAKSGAPPQQQQHQQVGGSKVKQHHTQSPEKVRTSANKAHLDSKPVDESQDFTTCMFCGDHNSSWNEDALDMHYWKDCPLLAPCPACAQVVEIAGLPEHLLDECEQKAVYEPCEVTGNAQ